MSLIAKRKAAAQEEFAKIFAKREAAIETLVRLETKLKGARRTLARLEKRSAAARALQEGPDLMSDKIEIPGFVELSR
jgi:hypothetical protein